MHSPQAIAIILARGGSKRLPGKNILPFHGKPMLAWSVEAALQSGQFERVLVSTDSEQIAQIAIQHGAEVPFLRHSAADDLSSSSEATRIALQQAQEHWGCDFDVVAQLMANCPLRSATDIRDAMNAFVSSQALAQISCFKFGWMNPWWAFTMDQNGHSKPQFPEALKQRSQDLPPLYCPTGALWITKVSSLFEHGTFYAPGHVFHAMDWVSALDIDDEEDLRMALAAHSLKRDLSP